MFEFNWSKFRGFLLLKEMTIKDWCKANEMDIDRYRNIQQGKVQPTDEEVKAFKKVLEG